MQLLASSTTPEKFAAATAKFHELMPAMIDKGAMVVYMEYIIVATQKCFAWTLFFYWNS